MSKKCGTDTQTDRQKDGHRHWEIIFIKYVHLTIGTYKSFNAIFIPIFKLLFWHVHTS